MSLIHLDMLHDKPDQGKPGGKIARVWIKTEFSHRELSLQYTTTSSNSLLCPPDFIRVTFECFDSSLSEAFQGGDARIFESNKGLVDGLQAGPVKGVTFRYKLDNGKYQLIQVFPTTWNPPIEDKKHTLYPASGARSRTSVIPSSQAPYRFRVKLQGKPS
jgi:hypothetical protein